jgi:hypothetical protein
MDAKLAALVPNGQNSGRIPENKWKPSKLQSAAAELYAKGWPRETIARALAKAFWDERDIDSNLLRKIRANLKSWEGGLSFRDLIWNLSVQDLDLQTPLINAAVGNRAKRGDVPAAKLALEIAGRYASKEQSITAVQVVLDSSIPRPGTTAVEPSLVIEGEAEEE